MLAVLPALLHVFFTTCLSYYKGGKWSPLESVILVQGYNVFLLYCSSYIIPWMAIQNNWMRLGARRICSETNFTRPIPDNVATHFILNNLFLIFVYILYDAPMQQSHVMRVGPLFAMVGISFEIFLCYITFEILEFCLHWLLHTPWMFKHIHYLHHETNALHSITGFYMHPLDVVLQIMVPVFVPLVLWARDVETMLCFLTLGLFFIHTGHSGYEVPFLFSGRYHYIHHKYPWVHLAAIEPFILMCVGKLKLKKMQR